MQFGLGDNQRQGTGGPLAPGGRDGRRTLFGFQGLQRSGRRMGSCLTCFKSPPNATVNSVEAIAGVVAAPETAITDTEAAVNGNCC